MKKELRIRGIAKLERQVKELNRTLSYLILKGEIESAEEDLITEPEEQSKFHVFTKNKKRGGFGC